MPPTANRPPPRPTRKGHYSCDFCRARKLRCSRPLPCINCVSRGKKCVLEADGGVPEDTTKTRTAVTQRRTWRSTDSHQQQLLPEPPTSASPRPLLGNDRDLLDEVQRLRRLAEDLERRIARGGGGHSSTSGDAPCGPASTQPPLPLPPMATTTPAATPPDNMAPICAVVTHLDRVSMGKGSYVEVQSSASGSPSALSSTTATTTTVTAAQNHDRSGLALKIEPILVIPTAPEYTYSIVDGDRLWAPKRCVYLPMYREATVFLDTFLRTVSSFYHIVHHPTVPATIWNVYDCIQGQRDGIVALGDVLLLLSIIATGTYLYDPPPLLPRNGQERERPLFASRDEAARQTPMWIQAALHVLDVVVRGPAPPTLSAVQGVLTLSFLISNVEGVGFRYRYIISTGLLLGRELGLHCIDQDGTNSVATTTATTPLERELGRRAWWYLASTDWLLAARNSGPGVGVYQTHPHMMRVNEPCNINDSQLTASEDPIVGLSRETPTDMSYFLQRVRLAKIARNIVDRMPMVSGTDFVGGGRGDGVSSSALSLLAAYRQSAIASDAELDEMLHDLPLFMRFKTYEQEGTEGEFMEDDETDEEGITRGRVFIQTVMLHSLIYTQRCKLHLSYLTSWRRQTGNTANTSHRPSVSSSSTSSRTICIEAARQIIHAETQLRRRASQHPFVKSRLSCVLYGVFLATIVLLIDLCAADNEDNDDEDTEGGSAQRADAFEALRIVADARNHSPAAAELYTSLTQLLAKHRPQLLDEGMLQTGAASTATTIVAAAPTQPDTETATPATSSTFDAIELKPGYTSDPAAAMSYTEPSYTNPLALNFEGFEDLVNFQWDDLLAGVDTSMFL